MLKSVIEGNNIRIGDRLTPKQEQALRNASVPIDTSFFESLEKVNEEILESYPEPVVEKPKPMTSPVARPSGRALREQSRQQVLPARTEPKLVRQVEPIVKPVEPVAPKLPVPKPAPVIPKEEPIVEREEIDLDKELSSIGARAKQTIQPQEEQPSSPSLGDQVLSLLKGLPNSPSDAQIAAWKAKLGSDGVYAIGFGKSDVYVFTHLTRGHYDKIQETMADIRKRGGVEGQKLESEMQRKIVGACVLWPPKLPEEFFYMSRAGVVPALYEAIMMNSYFLTTQHIAMLTTTL